VFFFQATKIFNFVMMHLDTYINDLLYRYECVIIPEFGAFLAQTVSASLNIKNQTFYPPKKVISFNEQLQNNDGLLVGYIADVERISFEQALKKVKKETKQFELLLNKGESITLTNIGVINFNSENNISFEPAESVNFLTASFGLAPATSPSIQRTKQEKKVETIANTASTTTISVLNKKTTYQIYKKYAAIIIVALGIIGYLASDYQLNQIEKQNQIAQETANKEIDAKINKATFIIDNPLPSITLTVTKQNGDFHIVAGAFRIKENCDKKLEQLQKLGYNARKIGANKYGLHQVVYSSYNSRTEAQKELYKIRESHNQNAWLLVQKLK
jgi:cell division protein FtsN